MANPVAVQTFWRNTNTATTHAIQLPSNVQEGDLLLVAFANVSNFTADTAGWTRDRVVVTYGYSLFHKVATGGETELVVSTTGTAFRLAAICLKISNWTAWDHEFNAVGANNCPEVSAPNGGTRDALWLAIMMSGGTGADQEITGAPTGFTDYLRGKTRDTFEVNSNSHQQIAIGRREEAVAAKEPGAFQTNGTLYSPRGLTIVVEGTSSARYGVRITGLKTPNDPDTLVTGVTTARGLVYMDGDDSGAPTYPPFENQTITDGVMEIEIPESNGTELPVVTGTWGTFFFRTPADIVNLDA
jgi:hypothetical protein